ncbi:anti sigma factor C-terminal domain-containing protein [Enterococcus casseliflavus]|uniref:anti sigma factor C-terminal domain-containing protein n=1 Tax=Enterococcus casseliflavus TaxID=37734 RepID=UPI0039A4B340
MDLNRSIKKAKRKQIAMVSCVSIVIFLLMSGILFFIIDKVATKNYRELDQSLFTYQTIASPNTQIDSQGLSNNTFFGGEVVTNQSKNIDGYIVPWSSLRSKYNFFGSQMDYNEYIPSWYHSSKNSYEYNRQTKQKVATFYNPTIETYYDGVKNELEDLKSTDDFLAEVAISFDQPYRYSEVKEMFPENVNVVWLYLFSEERDESKGPAGMPTYGFQLSFDENNQMIDAESDKAHFFSSFEEYISSMDNKEMTSFLQENENKQVDDIEVLGVMLTGQAKNLAELKDKSFVRGSSIGITVPIVPYITPEK